MKNAKLVWSLIIHFTFLILHSLSANAESVKVADCVRSAELDHWAASDVVFCCRIMDCVLKTSGLEVEHVKNSGDNVISPEDADVICSAFRTPELLKDYDFPLQPMGRMHFALYAMPSRAIELMSTKITEWPSLRVGYSPVSQGQNSDRVDYFEHAKLSPEYVEYPTSEGAVKALREGDIEVLFLYTPFSKRPEGLVEIVPIGARNVYFAVRKDKPELFERLNSKWRDCYIDHIDHIDAWREELLGIPKPQNRVRVAAYSRGDLFEVTPDGEKSGALAQWMKTICGITRWTPDYVYGGYDESLEDVRTGRLDLIGGIGFAASRREMFHYPHTPVGILRVYLWAHPGSKYKPGQPSTWAGMRVGMLANSVSAERVKRQIQQGELDITWKEYHTDRAMISAYFKGEVDACVDVEMPELENETPLHLYASHPMYICASLKRNDIFDDLEHALDAVCDDLPKYMRMISEHHYGARREMAALTLKEAQWLADRVKSGKPVVIDFSPWPVQLFDGHGHPVGLVGAFVTELARRTGLKIEPQEQTGIETAEAKFLRGETELWVPFPAAAEKATYGAKSVFAIPVPQTVADFYQVESDYLDFEMFANKYVPQELISILHKTAMSIDASYMQELFMKAVAERQVTHKIFGMTKTELTHAIAVVVSCVLLGVILFGSIMIALLVRQTKKANRAAAAAEDHAQAKTRFLAMMSHELRTPLNAVIGFGEFLAREETDEQHRREYIEGILVSSNALLDLINDILDLSKLEAGAMSMRTGACDVASLLKELPAIFGYRVRRHGVKLRIEAPPPEQLPIVELAQQGVRQILINLVGNAAKFTEQGEIIIRARWDAAICNLHLEVSDTGCGISQEKMNHLFDPFIQDIRSRMQSSSGEITGTGLGLPIVKRMVDNAGGTVSVTSELGKGTTFKIDIPNLVVVQNISMIPRAAEQVIREVLPERVLVVDDMTMNRKILGIHLGNLKIKEVRYAEDGEKAIEVMKDWIPDLVLTDMWMPKMDGTQLAEAMRRDRRLAEIPVVAVTADVDVGSTYDMSLFAKVIAKPVTTDKLRALFGSVV